MVAYTTSTIQTFSAEKIKMLRCDAKTQYYQAHILDFTLCDVNLEDFIDDYVEEHYRAQLNTTSSSVSLASGNASVKTKSKLRRLLHRITKKL